MTSEWYICPVCGYDKLEEPPGLPTFRSCYSCGFTFGDDDILSGISYDDYREKWQRDGMPWRLAPRVPVPRDWNPIEQLKNLEKLDPDDLGQMKHWSPFGAILISPKPNEDSGS